MAKHLYLIVVDGEESLDWAQYLTDNTAVCPNYRTAYQVGLSLSRIKEPLSSYRVSLEKLKVDGAVRVEGEERKSFTVVKTKFIKYF